MLKRLLPLLPMVLLLTPLDASADTILLYKGDKYDSVTIAPAWDPAITYIEPFTTKMRMRARVVLNEPLPPNATTSYGWDPDNFVDNLISFSIDDGVTEGHHGERNAGLWFVTDAKGKIIDWHLEGNAGSPDGYFMLSRLYGDYAYILSAIGWPGLDDLLDQSASSSTPGRWRVKTSDAATTVPEPGTLLLLSLGVGLLLARRRVER